MTPYIKSFHHQSPPVLNAGYEKIFYLLKQIQGSLETRLIFLQSIIKEAAR